MNMANDQDRINELTALNHELDSELEEWSQLAEHTEAKLAITHQVIEEFKATAEASVADLRTTIEGLTTLDESIGNVLATNQQGFEAIQDVLDQIQERMDSIGEGLDETLPPLTFPQELILEARDELDEKHAKFRNAIAELLEKEIQEFLSQTHQNINTAFDNIRTSFTSFVEGFSLSLEDFASQLQMQYETTLKEMEQCRVDEETELEATRNHLAERLNGATNQFKSMFDTTFGEFEQTLQSLQSTYTNVQQTMEFVQDLTKGTSVGMEAGTTVLDAAAGVLSSVA